MALKNGLTVVCCEIPDCQTVWRPESKQGVKCSTCNRDVCHRHAVEIAINIGESQKLWGFYETLTVCANCHYIIQSALYSRPDAFAKPYKDLLLVSVKALFREIVKDKRFRSSHDEDIESF